MPNNPVSWIGADLGQPGAGNWTIAAEWSTGAVPDAASDVTIPLGSPEVIPPQITSDVGTIGSLSVSSSAILWIGSDQWPFTQDGHLVVAGEFSNAGYTWITAANVGTTVSVASFVNAGGSLNLSGRATLNIPGAAGFDTPGALTGNTSLSNDALLVFAGGGQITDIQGNLSLSGAKAFVADAGDTTSNSALTGLATVEGSLYLYDGASLTITGDLSASQLSVADSTLAIGGILTNRGVGIGASDGSGPATLSVAGIVNGDGAWVSLEGGKTAQAKLDIAGPAGFETHGVLTGFVSLEGNSLIEFEGGGQITDIQGTLGLKGSQAFIADAGDTASSSALEGLSSVEGTLQVSEGASVATSGDLANTGSISVSSSNSVPGTPSSSLAIGGILTNKADITIEASGGNATISAGGIENDAGSLSLVGYAQAEAKLDISGPAGFGTQGVLTGNVSLGGSAVVAFEGGGQITDIRGYLTLNGPQAFIADGSDITSNSALAAVASVEGGLELTEGAALTIPGDLTSPGSIELVDSSLTIEGRASGSGLFLLVNGSTLEVGSSSSVDITFASTNAIFRVNGTGEYSGSLSQFSKGDQFIVTGASGISYDPATGTISYTLASGAIQTTHVGTGYDPSLWTDVNGVISYDTPSAPCFATGTMIRTSAGDRLVEGLTAGDLALTSSGEARQIAWLGRRVVDCSSHPEPETVWPFRIRAHAFGENRPARDLFLSPDHAVMVSCLSDVLIPIKHLDNGATIAQVPMESVTYWHVELESHDVLLAENLPAESFLDTRGKAFFGEAGFERSKADFATRAGRPQAELPRARTWEADACLPLVTEGPVVDAIRLQLLARAKALGWRQSDRVELQFQAERGGEDILVARLSETLFQLTLPARTGDIVLASRSFVPRHGDVATHDDRRLGVPLRRLEIQDIAAGGPPRRVGLDDPGLTQGFHAIQDWQGERWRWTDGRGALSSALWAGARGMVRLEIELARGRGEMRAWVEPEGEEQGGTVLGSAAL